MVEVVGAQHRVVVEASAGVVRRYPLRADRAAQVGEVAERWRAVHALGLPVPELLAAHAGAVGEAHLAVGFVAGVAPSGALADVAAARLGRDLADVLVRMRRVSDEAWPYASDWVALWDAAAEQVRTDVLPLLDTPARAIARRRWDAACAAARVAPDGLCHGDLTAPNVVVEPATGALAGLLDWDDVVRGDAAGDVACLHSWLPVAAREAMLAAQPSLADELGRHEAYAATWALQGAAWALAHDEPAILADCLGRIAAKAANQA